MISIEKFYLVLKENKKNLVKKDHGFVNSEFVKTCHEHFTRLKIFCMVGFIDLLGLLLWLGLFSLVAEAMEVKFRPSQNYT